MCGYNLIKPIYEQLGIREAGTNYFEGAIIKGDCPVGDYGRGILALNIDIRNDREMGKGIRMRILSIDSSIGCGDGPAFKDEEKLMEMFNNLIKELKDIKVFEWDSFINITNRYGIYWWELC